jgi:hypothetical protein
MKSSFVEELMEYTIEVYDKNGKCLVCGAHVSEMHKDGCEVGALRNYIKKCESEIRRLRHVLVQINIDTTNAINNK